MPRTKAQIKLLEQIKKLESENNASVGKSSEKDRVLFSGFLESLKAIVEKTDKQYLQNSNGSYPNMSEQEHKELLGSYKDAIKQSSICHNKIGKSKANLSQLHILSTIAPLLADDFNALNALDPQNPGSLSDAIQNARTLTVDVTGQELSVAGGYMSSRIPLIIEGEGKTKQQGFFTAEVQLSESQDLENIIKKSYEKYSQSIAANVQTVFRTEYFSKMMPGLAGIDEFKAMLQDNGGYNTKWVDALIEVGASKETIDALTSDSKFSDAVFEYTEDYYKIFNKYGIFESAGIDVSQNIEKRNSAMSTVADLLGKNKLIARSKPMKLIKDGVAINGIFMENADGVDLNAVEYDNPILNCNLQSVKPSTGFKDIADLQVLDYICGNVDRHGHNFFYKLDNSNPKKPVITGFTGIDNDCSFGAITKPVMKMIEPKNMGVISESMANSVKKLDENILKTALLNYNFTKEELSAAVTRLNNLKETIEVGQDYVNFSHNGDAVDGLKFGNDSTLFTIKDEDFAKLNIHNVASPMSKKMNLFHILKSSISFLPQIKDEAIKKFMDTQKNPQKNTTTAKRAPAQGALANIAKNHESKLNDQKLRLLLKNLDKTDPWYVRSSDEFKAMRKSLKNLCDTNAALPQNPSQEAIKNLENCYNDVQQKTDEYLALKGNSRDSKRARLRAGIAKDINLFAKENADAFYDVAQEQEAKSTQKNDKDLPKEQNKAIEDKKSYLEYLEQHKDNAVLYKVGKEANAAHTQLCELASKQKLDLHEKQLAGKNLAVMLAYEKLTITNKLWGGNSTEMDKLISKENVLSDIAEKLMQGENFTKITEDVTPKLLQDIVKDKGIKELNGKLDKMDLEANVAKQNEPKVKKEKGEQKKEKSHETATI